MWTTGQPITCANVNSVMLLARAAQRAAPLARARALSSTPTFTLHKFTDGNDFGFGRGSQFCMLNLRHDALFGAAENPAALLSLIHI